MKLIKIFKILAIIGAAVLTILNCVNVVFAWESLVYAISEHSDYDTVMLCILWSSVSFYLLKPLSDISAYLIKT